ncbi:Phage protein [Citrobacter portucalensis]|nr:Phage protein [Citrobacter portucalensis]
MTMKQWCKRRKESVKQKAVNDLYDAFELEKITAGETVKIATKSNLVIIMYREKPHD